MRKGPLIRICPEIRILIYQHVFRQADKEILGISREPRHDYENGPPSPWIADSRQRGLVYGSQDDREAATNVCLLRTCRSINIEATPVFYATNKLVLFAEDNNDIFYWLLDIGKLNRRSIRHLEIDWAYGIKIESGRGDMHGILEDIAEMAGPPKEKIQRRRRQLIEVVSEWRTEL